MAPLDCSGGSPVFLFRFTASNKNYWAPACEHPCLESATAEEERAEFGFWELWQMRVRYWPTLCQSQASSWWLFLFWIYPWEKEWFKIFLRVATANSRLHTGVDMGTKEPEEFENTVFVGSSWLWFYPSGFLWFLNIFKPESPSFPLILWATHHLSIKIIFCERYPE